MITRGELLPGARLNERLLTERFGISRTPLREAVKVLSAEGLVTLLPNRGAVVTTVTLKDAEDMFQLMAVLEALGGELACRRVSDEDLAELRALHEEMRGCHDAGQLDQYFELNQLIHQRIIDLAGNGELADAYRRVSLRIRRMRYLANLSKARWDEAMEEHDRILAALVDRDGERLKELLALHLTNKFKVIREWLERGDLAADGAAGGIS